jgi:hypothetical protein
MDNGQLKMENDFSDREFSIIHYPFSIILRVPAYAGMNRQPGDEEANET